MKKMYHQPVLADESIRYLITNSEGIYVDCTLGGGGHSLLVLQNLSSNGFLIGLDADSDAIAHASEVLKEFKNKLLRQIFYDQLDVVLYETGKYPVDGFFYDLGLSSFHIDEMSRGFSYQVDAPLDMRFDRKQKLTAAKVVNEYPVEALQQIIRDYGEELYWRKIAKRIVQTRINMELKTTMDLVGIVKSVVGEKNLQKSLARVFQAIRIEVNKELDRLKKSLELAFKYGKKGARILVISYHSLIFSFSYRDINLFFNKY